MEHIVDAILGLDGVAMLIVVGLLAFGEAAAFVGLLLPGEVAVLLGGVLASQGRVSLPALLLVVAAAAIAGDSAGYEIGRRWGARVLASGLVQRHGRVVCDVTSHMRRRGGVIVFLGRWTSVLRAVVPAVAGMSRMAYGRFLLSNVLGGVAWAAAFTLAGYAAGESYRTIEAVTGRGGWVLAGFVAAWVSLCCCAAGGVDATRSATTDAARPVSPPTLCRPMAQPTPEPTGTHRTMRRPCPARGPRR